MKKGLYIGKTQGVVKGNFQGFNKVEVAINSIITCGTGVGMGFTSKLLDLKELNDNAIVLEPKGELALIVHNKLSSSNPFNNQYRLGVSVSSNKAISGTPGGGMGFKVKKDDFSNK